MTSEQLFEAILHMKGVFANRVLSNKTILQNYMHKPLSEYALRQTQRQKAWEWGTRAPMLAREMVRILRAETREGPKPPIPFSKRR